VLGNFYGTPQGELNTFVFKYKNKACNEQCIGQSYSHKQFYKESAKMHQEPIPYIHLHHHQSCEIWHGTPQPSVGFISQHQLCCPNWHYTITSRQSCGCSFSHQLEKLHPPTESRSISGIPASSQFSPFCSWTFLPSMSYHSVTTSYHC